MNIEKVNIYEAAHGVTEMLKYEKIGHLNDHMLNIIKSEQRTLDFHTHEESDEMFFIIQGKMELEFEDQSVALGPGDFIIVPKGTLHRPVITEPVTVLLIEKSGTLNKGNTGGVYENS